MATNYIQEGKSMYLVTITGAESGDAFVVGDYLPCVLLTDADADDSHKATVATEGVFKLNTSDTDGNIGIGDMLYWTNKDTPLSKATAQKAFGIALEVNDDGENEILVMLTPKATVPDTVGSDELEDNAVIAGKIAANAVTTAKIMDANVTLAKLNADAAKFLPVAIADPGDDAAIPVTASGVCALTTTEGGGETRTLAIPAFIGQQLTLTLDVDGGDCVVTVAENVDGTNNTLTFDNDGETLILIGTQIAGALVWRIVQNIGAVGLSSV